MRSTPGLSLAILLFEVILFALASLMHGGRLISGYEHMRAAIAEAVIAAVLAIGLLVSLARPASARRTSMFVQAFALLGVCVGLVTMAIGVGPRTKPDLALHAVMLITLILGFLVALRSR
jgi:hypothetical protein